MMMAGSSKEKLLTEVFPAPQFSYNKITIVGVGAVGMACAISILTQNVSSHLCLIDSVKDKLIGEMTDLQHGSAFLKNAKIEASTDYAISSGSKICVVTAGVRQKEGETRLDLVQRNTEVMKIIIPQLVKHSPDTILLIVSNPVDILTYVAWKLSGLPEHRVIGSGTNLDTSRFKFLISQRLGVAPTSIHGYIIGEHGDSSVPIWSGVNAAGMRLKEVNPKVGTEDDPEQWHELHKKVVNSAYEVIKLKGYTSWAIGLCVSDICNNILLNTHKIDVVSTHIQGILGINDDVFLSLPAVLAGNGVTQVVKLHLSEEESKKLKASAQLMSETQKGLKM